VLLHVVSTDILFVLTHITNSMELCPSSEAASRSSIQEFPNNLWNLQVHYRVHKSPPLVPILSQINLVHTTSHCVSKIQFAILILSSLLRLGLPSGLFHSKFSTKTLYAFPFSLMHATCPVYLIRLNFIILIICGEKYKL
jgi:hypothetical protein